MLEMNNPEIRVDEIMRRIQEKVLARRETRVPAAGSAPTPISLGDWQPIDEALARAQEVAQVGASVPAMNRLRGVRRAVAGRIAQVFLRLAQLITRDQRAFNFAVLDGLRTLYERVRAEAAEIGSLRAETSALRSELASVRAELSNAVGDLQAAIRDQAADAIKLGQLRTSLSLQERRLEGFLEEAGKRLPDRLDAGLLESMAAESSHLWDATYLHFEDAFRGSRDEIKQRVAVYVPRFRSAGAGTQANPILDLGCGRGELLEVLRAEGLVGSGVDSNRAAVEQCREHGLRAELRDLFAALAEVPDGALGGLVALHVVEHLPFSLVRKLLDETLRVLRPGGIVIFETPNPKNVLVGCTQFYIDPTHRNPVHPETLSHLLKARGLIRVETMMLHPSAPELRLPDSDSELVRRFNEYFYGPQDYAVLGHRP